MRAEEIRLTAIQSIQIAIGAIYLLTGTMMPFLTDRPILERFVWATGIWSSSRSLHNRSLRPKKISLSPGARETCAQPFTLGTR